MRKSNTYETTVTCPYCGAVKTMVFPFPSRKDLLRGKWTAWARTSDELHKHFKECEMYKRHFGIGEYADKK
jgi:hypothetical protein